MQELRIKDNSSEPPPVQEGPLQNQNSHTRLEHSPRIITVEERAETASTTGVVRLLQSIKVPAGYKNRPRTGPQM